MSCKEAGELLGLPERSVRRAFHRGEMPGIRVGKRILLDREGINRKYDLEKLESSQEAVHNV